LAVLTDGIGVTVLAVLTAGIGVTVLAVLTAGIGVTVLAVLTAGIGGACARYKALGCALIGNGVAKPCWPRGLIVGPVFRED